MCSVSYNVSYEVQLLLSPTPYEFHIVNQYKNNDDVKFYNNIILWKC